ncbi:MAG: hypothetical protein KGI08_00305 [Thaumarchaeota archaeon]|nr:hypothetical protein [Nitrososphaerota archaeon]
MKITKITKEYYEVEGEKVYFFEPLEKVISIKDLQKIMDTVEQDLLAVKNMRVNAKEVVNKLKKYDKNRQNNK